MSAWDASGMNSPDHEGFSGLSKSKWKHTHFNAVCHGEPPGTWIQYTRDIYIPPRERKKMGGSRPRRKKVLCKLLRAEKVKGVWGFQVACVAGDSHREWRIQKGARGNPRYYIRLPPEQPKSPRSLAITRAFLLKHFPRVLARAAPV